MNHGIAFPRLMFWRIPPTAPPMEPRMSPCVDGPVLGFAAGTKVGAAGGGEYGSLKSRRSGNDAGVYPEEGAAEPKDPAADPAADPPSGLLVRDIP
jgi:hypothetical protein